MGRDDDSALSNLEYHVLLALAKGPGYGYTIKTSIETESGGSLTPRVGSLYRVLARLLTWRLIAEAEPPDAMEPHPGRARQYYVLTPEGRRTLLGEAHRLEAVAALARERLKMVDGP